MIKKSSRIIAYVAKKLMYNDILVVIAKMQFCCGYHNNVSVF